MFESFEPRLSCLNKLDVTMYTNDGPAFQVDYMLEKLLIIKALVCRT